MRPALPCLIVALAIGVAHAGDPRRRPPEGERPTRREDPPDAPAKEAPATDDPIEGRRPRRAIEGGGGDRPDDKALALEWREGGCAIEGHKRFVKALLASQNPSDAMSLEVWGDSHEYAPFQKVFYYLRVPLAAYVTLFWIGPDLDVFVPFQNLRIPANRDVSVDPDSIVVPPLGREQWVAIATLEPLPLPCYVGEAEHLSWLNAIRKLPHGIGRWEVRSKP